MKIRFLDDTYIRVTPTVTTDDPIGSIFKGTEIEVEPEAVLGESVQSNNRWYRDKNGWYYWSGRTEVVAKAINEAVGPVNVGVRLTPVPNETGDLQVDFPSDIPPGETRKAPSLEELLELDGRQRASLTPPVLSAPLESLLPAVKPAFTHTAGQEYAPVSRGIEAAILGSDIEQQRFWENPTLHKLNWAIQDCRIAQDWWQERRITGHGVKIAVLSTGVSPDQPDLRRPYDILPISGYNTPMNDRHGLGTEAAVLIAGIGRNVFGVAPDADLLIGKVSEQDYSITPTGLLAGIRKAIHAGADIIAMLVDFPHLPEDLHFPLQKLVDEATEKGILMLAPAGTVENRKPQKRYPACLEGVFSVGSHDSKGNRSDFSARGYKLDLLAPGEGLLVSNNDGSIVTNMKSTSLATAFAAGFMALVLQLQRKKGGATDPGYIYELLRSCAAARFKSFSGPDIDHGYGILSPTDVLKKLDETGQTQI